MATKPALRLMPWRLSVCRFDPTHRSEFYTQSAFFSVVRGPSELSVVCSTDVVPQGTQAEHGWRCFEVAGPIAFAEIGILAGIADVLKRAQVSIFAISTFDTDYILFKDAQREVALSALTQAEYSIV